MSSDAESTEVTKKSPPGNPLDNRKGLLSISFIGLVITQFLVALNDNMFRWLIIPIGKEMVGQDVALSVGSMCFLLPFLLFAAPAGYFTDRYSKRNVMIGCKVAEIVVMILGVGVILSGNIYLMLGVLFLMGGQSAFFSPSKYGSIPEIVRPDRISAANGVIGMTTMAAIILGALAGGVLYDATTPPSILIVDDQASVRETLAEQIQPLGFRVQEAADRESALDSILSGTPKLVLLHDQLNGESGVTVSTEIHKIAGSVPVLLLTDDSRLAKAAVVEPGGPNRCLTRTFDKQQLAAVVGQLAGSGEPMLTKQNVLPGQLRWWISAAALIGVAVVGWLSSLLIGRLQAANPHRKFPINTAKQTWLDLAELVKRRPLLLVALGSVFFWSLGAFAQLNIDKFARPELVNDQQYVGPLLGMLVLGIGIGSVLAGIWSAGKIELGLVPFGALGMGVTSMFLFTVPQGVGSPLSSPYFWACFWLLGLGLTAGLYDIPLLSFLQDRSPKQSRGRILAAYNFLAFSGMLLASGIFWLMTTPLGLSARQLWLVSGIVTLPVFLCILWLVLDRVVYVTVKATVRVLYRVKVIGLENIPAEGGALILPNHVSWIDGFLIILSCPRPIRFIVYEDYATGLLKGRVARGYGTITIGKGRKSMVRAIRAAREALLQGELVCIFPEGGLSRTGQIQSFNPGYKSVLNGADVPIIPTHLGGLWGSIFSFEGGKWFWKWPRRFRIGISLRFGEPIHEALEPHQVQMVIKDMEVEATQEDVNAKMIPARSFLRMCRKNMRRRKVADSTDVEFKGADLLMRTLILRRLLRREVLARDEDRVGILLPPSVGAVVTNTAISVDGRVAVNLNYTVSSAVMNECIAQAGIRHVLTSRKVMEKFDFDIHAELVYLEDFRDKVTLADKLVSLFQAWCVPVVLLERLLGLTKIDPDDMLTVIFTSGSTGHPKGVMLSHRNISTNASGFNQILQLSKNDVLIGILPFFHSFGYTTTMWSALTLPAKGVYHFNPLEPRQVGKLCKQHAATLLIATPTFLRSYVRRCEPEDLASLDVVLTGAERLPPDLADAFEEKFGVRPYEGYGATELSPVVSCSIPPSRKVSDFQQGLKEGTVGQPMPGISAKVVDLDTGEDLGIDKSGMLLIRGPNVMKGYLDRPELTAEVMRDSWYVTGDVAVIDSEGFIRITGRESRFSKIGGEMVPHIRIEEALVEALSLGEEELMVAVTAIADQRKGERLIVFHTGLERPPQEICRHLADAGLPPIWVPSPDSFCQIDEIPVLGTGKLDLKRIKELAAEKFSTQ